MNTDTTPATFRVWPTIRAGLHTIRRNAATIFAIALVARFVASQATSAFDTFTDDILGFSLGPTESVFIFFGSMLIMWLTVAQLTIRALDTASGRDSEPMVDRTWRLAISYFRSLPIRLFLRGAALLLVNYGMALCPFLLFWVAAVTAPDNVAVLLIVGVAPAMLFAWVSLRWTLAFPAMIAEDVSVPRSLGRSWVITKSRVGRLIGVIAITAAIVLLLSSVLGALLGVTFAWYSGTDTDAAAVLPLSTAVGQTVGVAFFAPIMSTCYYYLREGTSD